MWPNVVCGEQVGHTCLKHLKIMSSHRNFLILKCFKDTESSDLNNVPLLSFVCHLRVDFLFRYFDS